MRAQAIALYVDTDTTLVEIQRITGIDGNNLHRLFVRCIATHADGRIYGLRGLIPGLHISGYSRQRPVDPVSDSARGGASGAFSLLLETYPNLLSWLDGKVKRMAEGGEGRDDASRQIGVLHRQFLKKCLDMGIKDTDYPFNRERLGIRTLAKFVKDRAYQRKLVWKESANGAFPSRAWRDDPQLVSRGVTRPFEAVEFDGHKIDGRFTIRIADPFGFETIFELRRIWVLIIIDVATSAVLGYYLALGREYNKNDVAATFQAALAPHVPPAPLIPGLSPDPEGGFPSNAIPETQYACWDMLRFDAAKSHFAAATLERATKFIGCWTDNAVLGDKNARSTVERYFNVVSNYFAHRLPGTTGATPDSVERALNDPNGEIKLLMTLEELEQVVDVIISDSNARRLPALGNRTPLEAMKAMLARDEYFVRTLPLMRRRHLNLLQECRVLTIRGCRDRSRPPHVNFSYVRYTSERLSHSWHLLTRDGKNRLRIYFDTRDLRHLQAYTEDGQFFDTLTADRPWCFTPHSLWMRNEIMKCYRLGLLKRSTTSDPVQVFWEYKRRLLKENRGSVNEMARVLKDRADLSSCSKLALPPQQANCRQASKDRRPSDIAPSISHIFTY